MGDDRPIGVVYSESICCPLIELRPNVADWRGDRERLRMVTQVNINIT